MAGVALVMTPGVLAACGGESSDDTADEDPTDPIATADITRAAGVTATPQPSDESQGPRAYYLDAELGDDSSTGLSPAEPWQSVGKAASIQFQPGDSLLLKRGQAWSGQTLTLTTSGEVDNWITIGAYGDGSMPIIDGADAVNCISVRGQRFIRLQNLDLARGIDSGAVFIQSMDIEVIDCYMHDAGNDCLVFIDNCERCTVRGGKYSGAYGRDETTQSTGIEVADGGTDFLIDGAEVFENKVGLSIHNHTHTDGRLTALPANVTVQGVDSHDNQDFGFLMVLQAPNDRATVRFVNCQSHHNVNDGITLTKTEAMTEYLSGVEIEGCSFRDNGRYQAWVRADDTTFARCDFVNGRMVRAVDAQRLALYNCTLYQAVGNEYQLVQVDGARTDQINVQNCILAGGDPNVQMVGITSKVTGAIAFDANLYSGVDPLARRWVMRGQSLSFPDWVSVGQDQRSPEPSDPLFADPASGEFTLRSGSPAIDAGVVIAGINDDYLGSAPDLGSQESGV